MSGHVNGKSARLHLYVGVDFGTTFTGVSWMSPECQDGTIFTVEDWPGKRGEKVPSVLAKDMNEKDKKWGFLCDNLDESSKWKFLKLCLDRDPAQLKDTPWTPNSSAEAYKLVEEYLGQIYLYISRFIPKKLQGSGRIGGGWETWAVEFIFSVPGTWSPPVVHRFLDTAMKAGFGQEAHHKVVLGLTESVAAVVAATELNIPFADDDTILSIDAGGGTTDLAFVTLQSMKPMMMEQVVPVTAIGVGSVLIDMAFKQLVEAELEKRRVPPGISNKCAAQMSQSEVFQARKSRHGQKEYSSHLYQFAIGRTSHVLDNLGLRSVDFEKTTFDGLFDCQLEHIQSHVITALDEFELAGAKHVKHIVLSGGLGASEYIFQKLEEFLEWQKSRRPCLGEVSLWRSGNPQTAIIRGLLLNKKNDIFGTRIARASYGIAVAPDSREKSHNRLRAALASHDKDVEEQVQWVIKKGTLIRPNDRFTHTITRIFTESSPEEWTERIVSSSCSLEYLPQSMKDAGVEMLCQVHVPKGSPTEVKKGKWLFSSRYQKYECELQLVVGDSGECRVDVISSRGVELSKGLTTIQIQSIAEPKFPGKSETKS